MSLRSVANQIITLKIAPTKARIADMETKALFRSNTRDILAALSSKDVAKKVRNQAIAGIIALVCIAIFTYLLFFVLT